MRCPNCNSAVDPRTAWKTASNRFYCSEFCSDADMEGGFSSGHRLVKEEIDRQYLERLQKLLPYTRHLPSSALPSSLSRGSPHTPIRFSGLPGAASPPS